MSGIGAFLRLDGGPADADVLGPMLAGMAARGPDGEARVVEGLVALGHRLLATTPEAAAERMPLRHAETGCLLTGDIRLDNRGELTIALGLPEEQAREFGDGRLVLEAWLRWGERCLDRFLGDFAFVLWDPRQNRLFGARDQMGMRQLIYTHRPGRFFACATSPRALASTPGLAPRLNELRIAEALIGFEDSDLTSTFYEDVFRLAPGHHFTLDDRGLTIRRYWELKAPPLLKLNGDADYAEAFREVLTEAVRCRLRVAQPNHLGSMLSGGMDSGSVVALASRLLAEEAQGPLRTFSAVGPDPEHCVETRTIHAALSMPGLDPTLISYGDLDPWKDDLIRLWQEIEEPFDFHMTLLRALYLVAQRADVRVMLDGVAGDVVLGHGSQMARHIRAGRIRRAWKDAQGLHAFWGPRSFSPHYQIWLAVRTAGVPHWFRGLRSFWRGCFDPPFSRSSPIDPDFARRSGLLDRLRSARQDVPPKRMSFAEERIRSIERSGIFVGRERYDRVASALGSEPRDPFMDLRVMAFCLSLPMDQFQADGWPKLILRKAMVGYLPDVVLWRRGKQHLGWTFTKALCCQWPRWSESIGVQDDYWVGRTTRRAVNPGSFEMESSGEIPSDVELVLRVALFRNSNIDSDG